MARRLDEMGWQDDYSEGGYYDPEIQYSQQSPTPPPYYPPNTPVPQPVPRPIAPTQPQPPSGGGGSDPLAGYSAQEQDFLRRNQNQDGSYDFHRLSTAFRPTASNGGIGGSGDLNENGILDGEEALRAKGGGAPKSGFGSQANIQDLLASLKGLGVQFGGPADGGVFPDPVQQVGQDPFSQLITGGYSDIIGRQGATPFGQDIEATLKGLIERRGQVDEDPQIRAQRMEAKRAPIESFRRTQRNQMRGELANRNLISEPGQEQGAELTSLARLEEQLAPAYAQAGHELAAEDWQADNERLSQSLALATGMAQAQAQMYLSALNSATQRQQVLADIALGTLDRNIYWNKFLAELGLERDQIMHQLQNGRVENLQSLMMLFQQFISSARGGYV